jgi:type IV pilus assembly protein PilP
MRLQLSLIRNLLVVFGVAGACLLAGCSQEGEELEEWMKQQRAGISPSVTPLAAPKIFSPQAYTMVSSTDPFSIKKLESVLDRDRKHPCPLLLAEQSRRKGPLEAYPLDSIVMVGSFNKKGQQFALIRASRHLYQAKVGDYLGQNYGKIVRISESEISLQEIGQDPAGECEEQPGTLQLQEKSR